MMKEIRQNEDRERLRRIAGQTAQGQVDWKCVEYNPLCFMDQVKFDNSPAYLCQMFKLTATIDGLPYNLEIAEYITIPDGKGDVAITLTCDLTYDFCHIDEAVSGGLDGYDDCVPEDIAAVFKDNPAMVLSAAIVPKVADSEAVKETFAWARFINERGISKKLLNHPLTKLAEKLFNGQRVLDYHKIVFDTQYREQLLSEI